MTALTASLTSNLTKSMQQATEIAKVEQVFGGVSALHFSFQNTQSPPFWHYVRSTFLPVFSLMFTGLLVVYRILWLVILSPKQMNSTRCRNSWIQNLTLY